MLREIPVSPTENEPAKRWFTDANTDLFVWVDDDGQIEKFQICYNKGKDEHALSWNREQGFSHHAVDDGEQKVMKMKKSPILVQDGLVDAATINRIVTEQGCELPAFIYNFILHQLNQ